MARRARRLLGRVLALFLCSLSASAAPDSVTVLLHLGDSTGEPFTGASPHGELRLPLLNTGSWASPARVDWPSVPQVFCTPHREEVAKHPDQSWSEPLAPALEIEPGSFLFRLKRGFRYLLGVRGGDVACTSIEFDCREEPEGSSAATTHLCLQILRTSMREFEVQTIDPTGTTRLRRVSVRIEDAETGLPLIQRETSAYSPPAFRLPEGNYLVRSTSCGSTGLCGQDPDEGALYGGGQSLACLSECEVNVLVFMDRGGRLELDWTAEPEPERWTVDKRIEVFLHGEEGWPLRVDFLIANRSLMPLCWPGAVALSEPIPAGEYRLVARTADRRVAEAQVIVREGETRSLKLQFGVTAGDSRAPR